VTPEPAGVAELKFRDPVRARELTSVLHSLVQSLGRAPVTLMHVCGTHEQAIARFGLRAQLPPALRVIMGPGCPVCVTDQTEVDEGVALALQGVHIATYGDMLRLPGSSKSLADAQSLGAKVDVVYSATQAMELALAHPDEPLVFFASGFETTAVATAAILLSEPPKNFSVLSAHKYVPTAMEAVARLPEARVEGFLAAGHAAVITGYGLFEEFAQRHKVPVVVAGFEPLDILAALVKVVEMIRDRDIGAANAYPRCVTREGNRRAQESLWRVFETADGPWRGIGVIPEGNLQIRDEFAGFDARRRFAIDVSGLKQVAVSDLSRRCLCGKIMVGLVEPTDCPLFGQQCVPDSPVGACMVSSEGTCRIWHQYGGRPDLGGKA
jgi:hydrogenase expression/formation protein HypD